MHLLRRAGGGEHGDHARSGGPSRAQRYALHLPVLYRRVGEAKWETGTTDNLSDSGAVIRGKVALMPATAVEVVISLPSSVTHSGGCLTGEGRVVRTFTPLEQPSNSVFAITFTHYELGRREHVFATQ